MFTVGGTDLYIHKYLGSNNPSNSTDLTQPHYDNLDPTNIQDLLFLENRNRKYDNDVYRLRGHYNVQNLDFDLSQFGLFLTNDVIFVTVHYNQMIDVIGRKLMVGDVFELPHLIDYHPLDQTVPVGLRRMYQITDANYASEGFSQTWFPHLWRIKCEPLINSQEFNDILKDPINKDNYMGDWDPNTTYEPGYTVTYGEKIYTPKQPGPVPPGVLPTDTTYWELSSEQNLIDIMTTYNKNLEINQAVIDEAKRVLPLVGYDTSELYVVPTYVDNVPAPPVNVLVSDSPVSSQVTGTVFVIQGTDYKASTVLRIKNGDIPPGRSIILQASETAPNISDTGSGQMYGDIVVTAQDVGATVSVPYGTADNTFATADQFVRTIATFDDTPRLSTVIPLVQKIDNSIALDLVIEAVVFSENGTPQSVFPAGTRITGINRTANTITVSNPTTSSVPGGTPLVVAANFDGIPDQGMNYRADCDPRFQFIRRYSPRGFGYIAGYMTGDAKAPNGEPVQSGISFPSNARIGDYFLRIDYLPQKLFRYNGTRWVEISKNVRTELGYDVQSKNQLSGFINDADRTAVSSGGTVPTRQSLSQALRIQPD